MLYEFFTNQRLMTEIKSRTKRTTPSGKGSGGLQLWISSEARRSWKAVTEGALPNEKVVIPIGKRAVALCPVGLTYAEEEYGVTEGRLNGKAREVLAGGRKERVKSHAGADLL
jgi:hypothetical protein